MMLVNAMLTLSSVGCSGDPTPPLRRVFLRLMIVLPALLLVGRAAAGPADAPYLFSYHDDSAARLVMANSQDGIAFTDLPTLYTPPVGDGVRDPSIIRYRGTWYTVYTAGNFGFVSYFGVAKSDDFRNWTWVCNVATHPVGNIATWAPEFFLDTDGKLYVFVHVGRSDYGFNVTVFQPNRPDLSAWDDGNLVTGLNNSNLGYIDAQVTGPINGFYYMAVRPYGQPGASNPINILRSASLLTDWSIYKNGDFGHWQTPHNLAEAYNLLFYGNGYWRLYAFPETGYGGYPYSYSESHDDLATWTPWTPVTGTTNAVHGTILQHAPPIFTGDPPTAGYAGVPYRFTFYADGRPYPTLSLLAGSVPPSGLTFDTATGVLSGTPTTAGVYPGITLAAANAVLPDATHTYTLTISETFAHYAAVAGLAGAGAAPTADPDGDGLPNLLEYALNLRAAFYDSAAGNPLNVQVRDYVGARYLSARFTRVPLATDLTCAVEVSVDLANWTPLATSTAGGAFSGPGLVSDDASNPNPHLVEVRDTVPVTGGSPARRFLRLRVTQ